MLYQKLLVGADPYYVALAENDGFELHCHPEVELSCCLAGEYGITLDGEKYTLRAGQMAVIRPMTGHSLDSGDYVRLTVEMGQSLLGPYFKQLEFLCRENLILTLNTSDDPLFGEVWQLLGELAVRRIVKGENVDKNAVIHFGVTGQLLPVMGAPYLQLIKGVGGIGVHVPVMERIRRIQIQLAGITKLFVILPKHAHVDIVIPGDKAVVADCADQCAAHHKIGKTVLFADPVQFGDQIQLGVFYLLRNVHGKTPYLYRCRQIFSQATSG